MRWFGRWCAVAGLLVGCRPAAPPATLEAAPAEEVAAARAVDEPAELDLYLSPDSPVAPRPWTPATAVASFTWRRTLDLADAPEQLVTGRLRGRDFIGRSASVVARDELGRPVYRLRLSNQPRQGPGGFNLDDDAVTLQWSEPVGAGQWVKELGERRAPGVDAWYVVEQKDGSPLTRSADFAARVAIERVGPPIEIGGAPSLDGRLVMVFDDDHESWLAGRFQADGCR